MTVRLSTGASVTVMKRVVGIYYTLKKVQSDDDFIVLDSGDKFDVILVFSWLKRWAQGRWHRRTVDMATACSPDGHLMRFLERPSPCGYTTSDFGGLMCGSVISTTVQDSNVSNYYIVELFRRLLRNAGSTEGPPL